MRRISVVALSMILMMCILTGCQSREKIQLGFTASDVSNIELYHFNVPAQAEMKLVTDSNDIDKIIQTLQDINVKRNSNSVSKVGSTTLSFRFNLYDGTKFEIIFTSFGVKDGTIRSSYVFDYLTTSDVDAIWGQYDYELKQAIENQLPVYEQ